MHSFCANSLAPVKQKPKMYAQKNMCVQLGYVKAARRTLVKLTPGCYTQFLCCTLYSELQKDQCKFAIAKTACF
jgi:hypothetical protein